MFGQKLHKLREDAGMSRFELANLLGLSVNAVSNYENNIRKPKSDKIWQHIASIFGVSIDYLMDNDISLESSTPTRIEHKSQNTPLSSSTVIAADTISSQPQTIGVTPIQEDTHEEVLIKLPILGEVAAGYGVYADVTNPIIGYMDIPQAWVPTIPHEEYCVLKVSGDSMEPEIHEGDYALVRCQPLIDNGQIGIVLIDNENGVIKKIKKYDDSIVLVSLNSQYEPRVFAKEEMNRIRIFGIVKKIIREYN